MVVCSLFWDNSVPILVYSLYGNLDLTDAGTHFFSPMIVSYGNCLISLQYLPSCFAEKHLNGVSGFIKLQRPDGKQWPVRCLYKGGRAKLSQGWYDFSLENNLEEGDVCVFELICAREVILKVTTFRVVDDAVLLSQHPR